jgi:6-phosphogluconolactonase (cycloisomerase 2 family)
MNLLHFNKLRISLAVLNFFLFLGINSLSSQTVADFPFLATEIDQDNCCKNETVLLYSTPAGDFIYIQNNEECFGGGGRLFLADGTFYCEDTGINCLDFYGLSNGTILYECTSDQANIDLFDRFPFLSTLVDVNNCGGEMIEFFRNDLGHEFLCVNDPDGSRTFYYSTGQLACRSSETFDCVSAYGFDDMELVETFVCDVDNTDGGNTDNFVGAVFAMTNGEGQVAGQVQGPNSVVAYGQAADGTLSIIGSFPTGGNGGDFDGGEGLDPLISAYAITKSNDNQFVMAVNAGSNTVTSMRVNADYSLSVVDTESTIDIGPNSIAYVPSRNGGENGIVYVSNISQPEFLALGEPGQQGSIIGYRLLNDGSLEPIPGSRRTLANRPSAVQISPDGDFLVVASINAGAAALGSGSEDEIVVYGVNADGTLTDSQLSGATSTLRGNAEGRNLPSAIGFQIVDENIVVVTEAREFDSEGNPPRFPFLQDGSVSTWQIDNDGNLIPIDLDVASGVNNTGRTACWLDFSDENTFFVSNAIEAGLAAYSFNNGDIELLNQTAAQGTGATGNTTDPAAAFGTTEGWIDLWISDDGQYLYQCYGLTGEVGVYAIDGAELTLLQIIGGLPQNNVQGIVSVGTLPDASEVTATYRLIFDALWSNASHPADFPIDTPNEARWSPVAGLTHNSSVRLFNEGDIASPGLVNISQSGSRNPLDSELAAVIASGAGEFYIESATRVRPSPDTISTTFDASSSHPLLSLTSMIAPSPDWIVAMRDFNLFENGQFIESAVIPFIPYDTGSDSGETFRSENEDTQPRQPITQITDGILAGEDGTIRNLGFWRLERIDAGSNCNVNGGSLAGGPFTFDSVNDGIADVITPGSISVTGQTGPNNQFVVTDANGNILGLPSMPGDVDFDTPPPGLCYIYHLSFEAGLTGLTVGNNISDLSGCFDLSNSTYVNRIAGTTTGGNFVGGVYAMTNGEGQVDGQVQGPNAVVAYGQAADGTLTIIGTFPTGGNGGDFDGGEGLDPLISAYAITKSNDNKFVMAVNAGSNTVTSMRVNEDFTLSVVDTEATQDIGPNSIAYVPSRVSGVNGFVYVSNIAREENVANGEPGQEGSIVGYRLLNDGSLEPITNSRRELNNRPSAIQFSPDGDFVVVASINAGAAGLANGNQDEVVVYGVNADGTLSDDQLSGATSTLRGNAEGRNLPSAIGFQIVDENILVVTEAREFRPDGTPPVFPGLQDGSVSTWQITNDGQLEPIALDVATGTNNTGRTACWLDFSDDNTFFVSNAIEAGLASFTFNDGNIELVNQVAAQGIGATGNTTDGAAAFATTEGWIDLWISDDGQYLYQCYGLTGEVGVFAIDGTELTLIQEIGGLPQNNVQGIVSVGQQASADEATAEYRLIFDALWSAQSHPTDFPADEPNIARWSPVAGLTHDSSVRLFNDGDVVSQGLVNISQSGSRDPLDSELAGVINTGAGEFYIESNTRVRPSPDTISTTFTISESHSLVSVTSMIAPSPDWIVALRDFDLYQNGEFVESAIAQFIPYDTNSDSGESFASDNLETVPQGGIFRITDGILVDENGNINSLGIWRFERIDSGSNCEVAGGTIEGGPFTFDVDGTPDNIPSDGITLSGNAGANSQWVVTDANGYILGLPGSFTGPDFDEAGPGLCYVYHLSYDEITGLEAGNNIADFAGCFSLSNEIYVRRNAGAANFVGGVFAMTNGEGQVDGIVQGPNAVVAYGQTADGTLTHIGTYPTGGNGGDFDGGEGLDPLISAYAITKSNDNRFVLAVNAGSNTVTSMRVGEDFGLEVVDTEATLDIGPNSIAYTPSNIDGVNGLIYVSNISREETLALGEPGQQGSVIGYWLLDDGSLQPIANSRRELANRPSAIQFSPAGDYVVVASINAGAAGLENGNQDEIVLYGVNDDGTLSTDQLDGTTSTLRGNPDGRNLPSAIGFQIVGDNYVVVTEAREFDSEGNPPRFPFLQDGSVSTWQIFEGAFVPIDLDVASGTNNTGRTACWLDFSDENTFFVSNAIEAGLASYSFNDGNIELIDQVAAQGTGATGNTTDPAAAFGTTEGWIDLWISDDGKFLYQCYGLTGEVGVYEINGTELTLIQEVGGDLPQNNVQGIVAVGPVTDNAGLVERVATELAEPRASIVNTMISDLTVYPNPAASSATVNVTFNLEANAEVTLTVFSVDGSTSSLIHMNGVQRTAGVYTESLDISNLSNGFYIMQLSTPTGVMNEKLIIQN